MESDALFAQISPPVFDGTNYQVWVVRMEAYLDANDLWEAVEDEYEVPPLPNNPTIAQIKSHTEKRQRVCLFTLILVILVIFIFENDQNIYFDKHSFSFQHIQNSQKKLLSFSYSKKSFQIFFISQNIILILNLTILNVSIQILIHILTQSKWSTFFFDSK